MNIETTNLVDGLIIVIHSQWMQTTNAKGVIRSRDLFEFVEAPSRMSVMVETTVDKFCVHVGCVKS